MREHKWIPAIFLGGGESVVGQIDAFSVVMLVIDRVGENGTIQMRAEKDKDTERLRAMMLSEIYIRIFPKDSSEE